MPVYIYVKNRANITRPISWSNRMQNPFHSVGPNPSSSPAASVTVRGLGTSGPDSSSGFDSGSDPGGLLQLFAVRRMAHS